MSLVKKGKILWFIRRLLIAWSWLMILSQFPLLRSKTEGAFDHHPFPALEIWTEKLALRKEPVLKSPKSLPAGRETQSPLARFLHVPLCLRCLARNFLPCLSCSSSIPVNQPFSLLKYNTLFPFYPLSKNVIYFMLPHCLWDFHAYASSPCTWIKNLTFSCESRWTWKVGGKVFIFLVPPPLFCYFF